MGRRRVARFLMKRVDRTSMHGFADTKLYTSENSRRSRAGRQGCVQLSEYLFAIAAGDAILNATKHQVLELTL